MTFVKRPSKQALSDAIFDCGGVIVDVARRYGVTRKQVYVWIKRFSLQTEVERARLELEDKSYFTAVKLLDSPDTDVALRAAITVLNRMDNAKGFMKDDFKRAGHKTLARL